MFSVQMLAVYLTGCFHTCWFYDLSIYCYYGCLSCILCGCWSYDLIYTFFAFKCCERYIDVLKFLAADVRLCPQGGFLQQFLYPVPFARVCTCPRCSIHSLLATSHITPHRLPYTMCVCLKCPTLHPPYTLSHRSMPPTLHNMDA